MVLPVPSHSLVAFQSQEVRPRRIFEPYSGYHAEFDHRSIKYGRNITMGSIYTPLDIENYEIRMLIILPDLPTSVLRCTLEKASLITPSRYAALSYCWGNSEVTETIIVNDVDTPVTVNLADALKQLRTRGVGRIWADALCINQRDRQEKSLQIRNMKFIYSKADTVYAWLGKEGDGSTFVLSFFESLLQPQGIQILSQSPHNHESSEEWSLNFLIGRNSTSYPLAEAQSRHLIGRNRNCQRCVVEVTFGHYLTSLLDRPYWRRLWIIQEISVAINVQVLCGHANMSLDDLKRSISRCQSSPYWQQNNENVYSHLKRIMEFRYLYYNDRISLCKAIANSKKFLSTDPRDKIFALLGICHDGNELVPTPNYQQDLDLILTNITRALIHKNKCLDIITINGQTSTIPSTRPSWAPDWFSANLPEEAFILAEKQLPDWHSSSESISLLGGTVLEVQGKILGKIVSRTSTTKGIAEDGTGVFPTFDGVHRLSTPHANIRYYGNDNETLLALCSCLMMRSDLSTARIETHNEFTNSFKWLYRFISRCYRLPGRLFSWYTMLAALWHIFPALWKPRKLTCGVCTWEFDVGEKGDPHSILKEWLEFNSQFLINGRPLKRFAFKYGRFGDFFYRDLLSWQGLVIFYFQLLCLIFLPTGAAALLIHYKMPPRSQASTLVWVVAFWLVTFALFFGHLCFRRTAYKLQNEFEEAMIPVTERPFRLIKSDLGFLGMACYGAKVGDSIGLLTGCTSPVILREVADSDRRQYLVIGNTFIHLSDPDWKRFRGSNAGTLHESQGLLLRNWQETDAIQTFELV